MLKIEVFSCEEFSVLMIKEVVLNTPNIACAYKPLKNYVLRNNLNDQYTELLYMTRVDKIGIL